MKKFWKGFGWFVICGLVLLAAFGIQMLAGVAISIPAMIKVSAEVAKNQITDPAIIMQMSTEMSATMMETLLPYALLGAHVITALVFGLWYRFGLKQPIIKGVKTVMNGKTLLVTVLLAFGMGSATNFAMPILIQIYPESSVAYYEQLMEQAAIGVSLISNIAAVLVAPIGEELLFRGVTLRFAEKATAQMNSRKAAFWIANTIQAFMFGAFHANFVQGSYAFVMGLGFGYLIKRYKSIVPCIIAHMVINGSSVLIWNYVGPMIPENNLVYIAGSAVFMAMCVIVLKMGGKCLVNEEVATETVAEAVAE